MHVYIKRNAHNFFEKANISLLFRSFFNQYIYISIYIYIQIYIYIYISLHYLYIYVYFFVVIFQVTHLKLAFVYKYISQPSNLRKSEKGILTFAEQKVKVQQPECSLIKTSLSKNPEIGST